MAFTRGIVRAHAAEEDETCRACDAQRAAPAMCSVPRLRVQRAEKAAWLRRATQPRGDFTSG
jgi:hypothetical protein